MAEDTPPQAAPAADQRDPLEERTLDSQVVYTGSFFRVWRDAVRCPDGHVGVREFIRHPGAVMVVPLVGPRTVLLERQYRYPLARSFIEMPAGKLEPGEDPLACGQRELLEETGYRAQHWERLGAFHNAIGYTDERIEVFLAQGLEHARPAATDAGEVLEVFTATIDQLLQWIDAGRVTDVKTIIGTYWLERYLARQGGAAP